MVWCDCPDCNTDDEDENMEEINESYGTWLNEMNELLLDIGYYINNKNPEISQKDMAKIRKQIMYLYESLTN
jgi:hypothetical protein